MKIKAIVFDVDGTLTDGGLYIGSSGEQFKKFNVKDGYGIHTILPKYNIIPIVITGRSSGIVKKRCEELEITELHQGIIDKKSKLLEILDKYKFTLEEIAYLGDDLNDTECMGIVGLSGCPNDALPEVKKTCDYVCSNCGGYGAAREFIDYIVSSFY